MKRTALKRKTPLRSYTAIRSKPKPKASTTEAWIKAIPPAYGHGTGDLQHRLWRLVSDYVRIRDFHTHKGRCVATGAVLPRWQDGQAGHFKAYSVCNGRFKYDTLNIHLQSAMSNKLSTQETGHHFGEELKKRYGPNILNLIEESNKSLHNSKFGTHEVKQEIKNMIILMASLPEQPDYYDRVIQKLYGNV